MSFVIILQKNGSSDKYLARDYNSGGYFSWSNLLSSAESFKTKGEAEIVLEDSDFTRESKRDDGKIFPPAMIHRGLELSFKNPGPATAEISICEIEFKKVFTKEIRGSIIC